LAFVVRLRLIDQPLEAPSAFPHLLHHVLKAFGQFADLIASLDLNSESMSPRRRPTARPPQLNGTGLVIAPRAPDAGNSAAKGQLS